MVPGLISSVLDTWRAQCAVSTPEPGCLRSTGLGRDTRRCVSIVMDEGLHHQRGFETDHEGQGLIIRDEAGLEGSSPR